MASIHSSALLGLVVEASTLTALVFEQLRGQYQISEDFQLLAPSPNGQVISPSLGFNTFYLENLRLGLRFPIPEFL